VAVSCSQCGGHVSVPEPDASKTWEEQIRLYFGSSKHTPTCALRRSRHGTVPDDAEDLKSKHQISLSRANKKRAPPPLPSDAGKLRESFPFPPFSVSNGLPNRWPCFSIPLRDCAVSGSPFHPCLSQVVRMDLGAFQARSKQWRELTGDDGAGRDTELTGYGEFGGSSSTGTSQFSPTLVRQPGSNRSRSPSTHSPGSASTPPSAVSANAAPAVRAAPRHRAVHGHAAVRHHAHRRRLHRLRHTSHSSAPYPISRLPLTEYLIPIVRGHSAGGAECPRPLGGIAAASASPGDVPNCRRRRRLDAAEIGDQALTGRTSLL